jgi:hypothetical protein
MPPGKENEDKRRAQEKQATDFFKSTVSVFKNST